jgi:signal peptidase I
VKAASYRETKSPEDVLQRKRRRLRRKKSRYSLLLRLTVTVSAVFILFGLILGLGLVRGQSMTPAFQDGDIVVIWRLSGRYACGDVLLLTCDGWEGELIKRVAAVPGDTVDTDMRGRITVNGRVFEDTYIKPDRAYPILLMEDEYFVLGDSRHASADSRNFGPVKKGEIGGRVVFVLRTQMRACN